MSKINLYATGTVLVCAMKGGIDEDGEPEDNRTKIQKIVLLSLLKSLKSVFKDAVIQGHRDFPDVHKACPSFDAKKRIQEYLKPYYFF
jgi:N-acetylmuramoyl-L-alanine amidase